MEAQKRHLKGVLLAVLIVLGFAVQCDRYNAEGTRVLTVAGTCFSCVEGVTAVVSGYTRGTVGDPTYRAVTDGGRAHFAVVRFRYDPARLSDKDLYRMFFRSIDPNLGRGQVRARGVSYRMAIVVTAPDQRETAHFAGI